MARKKHSFKNKFSLNTHKAQERTKKKNKPRERILFIYSMLLMFEENLIYTSEPHCVSLCIFGISNLEMCLKSRRIIFVNVIHL